MSKQDERTAAAFAAAGEAQRQRWRAATPAERMRALSELYDFALRCGALDRARQRRAASALARWRAP